MSTLTCPHCGEDIELVGQRELSDHYSMGPNPVAHARSLGIFPLPVLSFGNRNMWLKSDIDAYVEKRTRENVSKLVASLEDELRRLPEPERKLARELLTNAAGKKR